MRFLARTRPCIRCLTRQLTKRQLTWLRATKETTEFDCLAEDLNEQVLLHLRQRLPKTRNEQSQINGNRTVPTPTLLSNSLLLSIATQAKLSGTMWVITYLRYAARDITCETVRNQFFRFQASRPSSAIRHVICKFRPIVLEEMPQFFQSKRPDCY